MNKRVGVVRVVVVLSLLFLPVLANAEGTGGCGEDETVIIPDGRVIESTIPATTTFYFLFHALVGRSYSVEVKPKAEPFLTLSGAATLYAPTDAQDGTCSTPIGNDTMDIAPKLTFGGSRLSIIATDSANIGRYRIVLANGLGSPVPYSFSVSETTLYNPRWSTFGGFSTSWGFHNTTNATINVTFRVISTTGSELSNTTFPIAADRVVFRSTSGLGIAASQAGNAFLAHDGPPGAIQADGFMVSPDGLTGFPVRFEPMREESIN